MKLLLLVLCVFTLKVFCLNKTTIDQDIQKEEKTNTTEIDYYDFENSTTSLEYDYNSTEYDDYNYYENYDYENSTSDEDDYYYYTPYENIYKEYKLMYKGKKLLNKT